MKAISISKSITNRSEINDYLKDVAKIPLLNKEEEIDLATKARNGDKKAKDKLIISNLRFVITVAKKYQNNGLPLADLINEGNIGLIRAAELFDPNKGFKFISYAVWWIRQAIVKAIQNTNRTIRIPSTQYSILYNINKEISNFYQKNERQPSAEELSIIMNIPEEKIIKLLEYNNRMSSIDTPISDDEDAVKEFGWAFKKDFIENYIEKFPADSKIGTHPFEVYFNPNPFQCFMSVGCYNFLEKKWEVGP